jgi:hypothetical protein
MGPSSLPHVPLRVRLLWCSLWSWIVHCWSCLGNLPHGKFTCGSCRQGASYSIKKLDLVSGLIFVGLFVRIMIGVCGFKGHRFYGFLTGLLPPPPREQHYFL